MTRGLRRNSQALLARGRSPSGLCSGSMGGPLWDLQSKADTLISGTAVLLGAKTFSIRAFMPAAKPALALVFPNWHRALLECVSSRDGERVVRVGFRTEPVASPRGLALRCPYGSCQVPGGAVSARSPHSGVIRRSEPSAPLRFRVPPIGRCRLFLRVRAAPVATPWCNRGLPTPRLVRLVLAVGLGRVLLARICTVLMSRVGCFCPAVARGLSLVRADRSSDRCDLVILWSLLAPYLFWNHQCRGTKLD